MRFFNFSRSPEQLSEQEKQTHLVRTHVSRLQAVPFFVACIYAEARLDQMQGTHLVYHVQTAAINCLVSSAYPNGSRLCVETDSFPSGSRMSLKHLSGGTLGALPSIA